MNFVLEYQANFASEVMERVSTRLCIFVTSVLIVLAGCTDQDDRSSSNGAAVQAQSSNCIHAIQNSDNISFLNTCAYPITAAVFGSVNLELDIEPHTSVDRTIIIPEGGLDFAACRQPYIPRKEVAGQYYCDSKKDKE